MATLFKVSKWLLLLPVLGIAIVSTGTLFPFIVGKYVWFRSVVDLALIMFLLGLLLHDENEAMWNRLKSVIRKPLVFAVSIFIFAFLLACAFGVDPSFSFWSNFERGEGGLQLLHFWVWFVLLITLFREDKDWDRLFNFALIGGALMALYGIFAMFGVKGYIGPTFAPGSTFELTDRFSGSIGNSAYTAAYSIFMLYYIGFLLAGKYRKQLTSGVAFVLYGLSLVFLWSFFYAATRGAFLGLMASLVVLLGYFVYTHKEWRKWLYAGMIAIFIFVGGGVMLYRSSPTMQSIPVMRIFDLSSGAKTFSDRAIMWNIAIRGFHDRPVFGWGPENYIHIFDQRFDINYFKPAEGFGAWFDRAHSIYLDYLAETGIVGLASFLMIFVVFYHQFLKKREGSAPLAKSTTILQALVFSVLIAYLVQGIVLFDVSPIYMNVFLILAYGSFLYYGNELSGTKEYIKR